MSEPSIVIEGCSLEMIPLDWWIVSGGVMENFSGSNCVVSVFPEMNRDCLLYTSPSPRDS